MRQERSFLSGDCESIFQSRRLKSRGLRKSDTRTRRNVHMIPRRKCSIRGNVELRSGWFENTWTNSGFPSAKSSAQLAKAAADHRQHAAGAAG
jgi:hypothetical protein